MSTVVTPPIPTAAPLAPTTPHPASGPRPWRCSLEQFEKLIEAGFFQEKQYELIRGEIIDMGDQGPRHYTAFILAVEVIKTAFGAGFCIRPAGPVRFGDSRPEPDVAVVPGSVRDYATAHPATALFALEISETSLSYDLTTKVELYATAGVPEYWVLDLDGKQLHVFRDPVPLPNELEATTYKTKLVFTPGDTVTPLRATNAVNVADLFP